MNADTFVTELKSLAADGERSEDRAIDLIFDYFVDSMARGDIDAIESAIELIHPEEIGKTCTLSVLHTTYGVADSSIARRRFYDNISKEWIDEMNIREGYIYKGVE